MAYKIPNEIWLMIMSHLNYHELKSCQRVDRLFNALTECKIFDGTLFRASAIPPVPRGSGPQIILDVHPALDYFFKLYQSSAASAVTMNLNPTGRIDVSDHTLRNGIVLNRKGSNRLCYFNDSTLDELATMPPLLEVTCTVKAGPWNSSITQLECNDQGVRVRDVLEATLGMIGILDKSYACVNMDRRITLVKKTYTNYRRFLYEARNSLYPHFLMHKEYVRNQQDTRGGICYPNKSLQVQ